MWRVNHQTLENSVICLYWYQLSSLAKFTLAFTFWYVAKVYLGTYLGVGALHLPCQNSYQGTCLGALQIYEQDLGEA